METRALLVVALLAGCASEPADAWVGGYDVHITERAWVCEEPSGPPARTDESVRTWMLEPAGPSAVLVPGLCPLRFELDTATRGHLAPGSCSFVTDAGSPGTATVVDGSINRDGDAIWGTVRLEIQVGASCARTALDFDGLRY